ncbi:hypothetical protein COEREDRAFT_12367 [Coemansia reversa NRRL 1564]|uniref:Uncharacterized protein n=1 Tax=Coemansia reversa (strain ATCC 12441 / NRRL 1564) TaxID=763665 RepID=A0A2G5B0Z1_COERN|nr:hypothetical protein COEREDRAFT_12367 [Coemansia reversa NRRL 1564]|eukprot:PIA12682.1 hypothetical protein COEREDRAFT_12367 [Coemansia reversa NRRL 1564]
MLSLDGSLPIWVRAVIVGFDSHWDVLVGNKELTKLGVHLMTPAMQRCLRSNTQTADHPAKALDNSWQNRSSHAPQEADYDDVPDTALTHDLAFPSLVEASTAAPADALYLEASEASVKEHLYHQCENEEQAEKLLSTLLTGKGAIHEYPGGCPPPAAYAPIQPLMHTEAKPIYVVQHMLSDTVWEARDKVVSEHIQYSIDEPSRAFTQLPIFTKSKPYTDEQCVLFDDSANNSLNMISISMQLPMPMERALFLRNACIISSIDMASFFTQLCLADDIADYWTYDGGERGKL